MKIRSSISIVLGLILASFSIDAQAQNRTATDLIPSLLSMVSESTYTRYLKDLESFGTRHALQPNRDTVASWIAHQFQQAGYADVVLDYFIYDTTTQSNVVATIRGSDTTLGEIVIGAHYDSQSFNPFFAPGADDNASGTSAVLEIARVLKASSYAPRRTLRLIAFGAEEMGLKGSEWYASRLVYSQRTISFMINFDMIGTRYADSPDRDVNIVWYDGAYAEALQDSTLIGQYTNLTPVLTTKHRFNSDSWSFAQRGIKSVFHIESDFSQVYHSPNDSVHRLDLEYATENVKAGLALYLAQDGGIVSGVSDDEVPVEWGLEQNYPNPFNGQTVIGYRIAGSSTALGPGIGSWVSLRVYDLLGQVVSTLVESAQMPGSYSEVWDAADLPSGTYIARLSISDSRQIRSRSMKMTLIR